MPEVVSVACAAPPAIAWKCPRCPSRSFVCSQRFRMNTNGKLADVWLIYRCDRCDATKNLTVVERTPIASVGSDLLSAATTNDAATARRLARDRGVLRRAGVQVVAGDRFVVDRVVGDASDVRLEFEEPLLVELLDVVAATTGLSRSKLRGLERAGSLSVDPDVPLRRLRLVEGNLSYRRHRPA